LSFLKGIHDLWDHLRGKGPAAAVALTLDLAEARENKPYMLEAGGLIVEECDGDLYARINGPNGDGINLQYVRRISYPFSSLFITNPAQAGKSSRLVLLPAGMDAGDVAVPAAAAGADHNLLSATHPDTLPASVIAGDLVHGNATPKWARLAKGTDGQYLKLILGLPAWADPPAAADHNLLSATHPDTLADSVVAGDLVIGNATPKWARLAKGTDGQFLKLVSGLPAWADAPAGGGPAVVRTTADVQNTATSYIDATGLSFSLAANTTYVFQFFVRFQTVATTTGINLSINGPASPAFVIFMVVTAATATTLWGTCRRAYDTGAATTGVDLANADVLATITGLIRTGASGGTLIVRFASEVAGSAVTIKAESSGILHTIG